jgi:hypothetical protein
MSKPGDGIEFKTEAVKQVIKKNGEVSVDKYEAKILASRTHETMSIILQTNPKVGIAVKLEDIENVINQINNSDKEMDCLACNLGKERECVDYCRDWENEEEETCGNPYTDLWVKLKYTLELSEYCKAIREEDTSPAFSSAVCNKCIEKECRFLPMCAELLEMNAEDHLMDLEKLFKEAGYTEQQIEEIKHVDEAETTEEFIDNLNEERSYWES